MGLGLDKTIFEDDFYKITLSNDREHMYIYMICHDYSEILVATLEYTEDVFDLINHFLF